MFEELLGINPWTSLFILLNTLTIYLVAKKYLFAPVMKIVADRQQEIDSLYAQAGSAKTEAEALRTEYRQNVSDAQAASAQIIKDATAQGQARGDQIIRKANAEAAAIMEKASADIAQERKKALNDAKNQISDLALVIAGKVVERELNTADQSHLIDSFIDDLEAL